MNQSAGASTPSVHTFPAQAEAKMHRHTSYAPRDARPEGRRARPPPQRLLGWVVWLGPGVRSADAARPAKQLDRTALAAAKPTKATRLAAAAAGAQRTSLGACPVTAAASRWPVMHDRQGTRPGCAALAASAQGRCKVGPATDLPACLARAAPSPPPAIGLIRSRQGGWCPQHSVHAH